MSKDNLVRLAEDFSLRVVMGQWPTMDSLDSCRGKTKEE